MTDMLHQVASTRAYQLESNGFDDEYLQARIVRGFGWEKLREIAGRDREQAKKDISNIDSYRFEPQHTQ